MSERRESVAEAVIECGELDFYRCTTFWKGKYEGWLKDGKPHGQGVMVSKAYGDVYKGEFKDGNLAGHGTWKCGDGHLQYSGEWAGNVFSGNGVEFYKGLPNVEYEGQFMGGCW